MGRPLSLADLPEDVARFAEAELASGRFSTVEDVIRAGAEALREREEDEAKLVALRAALEEGERSGRADDASVEGILRDARARHAQ
jgi:antitoxin ParD1/3/4